MRFKSQIDRTHIFILNRNEYLRIIQASDTKPQSRYAYSKVFACLGHDHQPNSIAIIVLLFQSGSLSGLVPY